MQMDSRSSHPRIRRGRASERGERRLSPKKSKSRKIDECDFSIMCSGTQNRFKSNPLTQIL